MPLLALTVMYLQLSSTSYVSRMSCSAFKRSWKGWLGTQAGTQAHKRTRTHGVHVSKCEHSVVDRKKRGQHACHSTAKLQASPVATQHVLDVLAGDTAKSIHPCSVVHAPMPARCTAH